MKYYIISFVLALIIIFIFKKIAFKFNIVDKPNERKVHEQPKPLLGGLSIYLSIFLTYSYYINFQYNDNSLILLIGGFALVIVGLYDDFYDMKAYYKLFFQILIAGLSSYLMGGIDKIEIYNSYPIILQPWQGILVQTIWVVALINAFNLIDGLDGLSSGMGIISLTTLLIMTMINQDSTSIILILIVIGSLLGFLYYNFYPSSIFLGDSGSMFLGYVIALISIDGYKTVTLTSTMLLLLIAFMPFLDVFLAIVRRKKNKQKAFAADSLHFHHRLLRKGFTHTKAVLILYTIMVLYAIAAISLELIVYTTYKLIILIILIFTTIFIFEQLYLLSDKYAYVTKTIKFIKNKIIKRHKK